MSQFSSWDLAISISVKDTQTIYKTFNGSVSWCFSSNWKENWQKFLKGDAFITWKGKQTKHTFLHFRCECAVCILQSLTLHFRSLEWKFQSFAGSVIMSVDINRPIVHCMWTHSRRRVGLHEDQHISQYCVRMLFQIFCVVWAILLVTSNVSSQSPIWLWEENQLGQMLQFQQHLFRTFFFINDVMCHACIIMSSIIPFPSILNIWRRGGLTVLRL